MEHENDVEDEKTCDGDGNMLEREDADARDDERVVVSCWCTISIMDRQSLSPLLSLSHSPLSFCC
jgi:hypothetical protein